METKQQIAPLALDIKSSQLGKLLLLLGSNHDGEVVAAARAIERVLRSAGRDWHDLVAALLAPESNNASRCPTSGTPTDMLDSDRSTVGWCHQRRHLLNARDQKFIENLMTWCGPISGGQRQWLHDIVGKLDRAEAA